MRRITTSLFISLLALNTAATELNWTYEVPGTPDLGTGTRFSANTFSFTLPLERAKRGNESLQSDFNLDMTEFRWEGANAAEGEYFWISAPVRYRQKRGNGGEFHLMLEPGLMTDLDAVGADNLNVNLEVSGRTYTGRTTFWQYGIVVNREFGDRNPRPLIALATKITPTTEMLLGFPRTSFQTRWSKTLSSFARIYPDGGFWREEVDGVTPAKTTAVAYTNWRMGVGAEFRWRDGMWLSAEIGQMRNRTIRATDSTGAEVSADPADNGYWRLGGSLRF